MKPMVFNYQDYVKLQEENKRLREENTNLRIRCRIAESEKPDRDCSHCKHNKPDGCSRWECEYEPVMVEVVRCKDCKWHPDGREVCQYLGWDDDYCSFGERREP